MTKKYNNLDLAHQQLKEKQQGTLEELDIVKQRLIEAQQELVEYASLCALAKRARAVLTARCCCVVVYPPAPCLPLSPVQCTA